MRISALDGLRGVAALLVSAQHFARYNDSPIFDGLWLGRYGVIIFFVLSGFLMTKLYCSTPFSAEAVSEFFKRRVARVIPLYVCIVVASYVLFLWGMPNSWPLYNMPHRSLLEALLFVDADNVLWTVPIEVRFYAVFPLLWWLAWRYGTGSMAVWLVAFGALLALLGFPSREELRFDGAAFFLVGVLAAIVPLKRDRSIDALFVVAVLMVIATMPRFQFFNSAALHREWATLLMMLPMFLLIVTAAHSRLAELLLGNRVMVFYGAISYSYYMLHFPVIRIVKRLGVNDLTLAAIVCFVSITAVAALSYRFLELPGQRFVRANWWTRRQTAPELQRK